MKNYILKIYFTLYILVTRLLFNHVSCDQKYINIGHYLFASHVIISIDIIFHSACIINILVFVIENMMYQSLEWLSPANRKLFP